MHLPGAQFAHLTFLAPEAALELADLPPLLEYLLAQAGSAAPFALLAEVDEDALAFESLRQAGFAIYARQRIWQLDEPRRTIAAASCLAARRPTADLICGALVV